MSSGTYRFISYTGERIAVFARASVDGHAAAKSLSLLFGVPVTWTPA